MKDTSVIVAETAPDGVAPPPARSQPVGEDRHGKFLHSFAGAESHRALGGGVVEPLQGRARGHEPGVVGPGCTGVVVLSSSRMMGFVWRVPTVTPRDFACTSCTENCSVGSGQRSPMIWMRNDFSVSRPENVSKPAAAS